MWRLQCFDTVIWTKERASNCKTAPITLKVFFTDYLIENRNELAQLQKRRRVREKVSISMQKYDTMGLHEALSTVNVQCSDPLVLQ